MVFRARLSIQHECHYTLAASKVYILCNFKHCQSQLDSKGHKRWPKCKHFSCKAKLLIWKAFYRNANYHLPKTLRKNDVLAFERGSSRVRGIQVIVPWSVTRSKSVIVNVPLGATLCRWLYGRRTPSANDWKFFCKRLQRWLPRAHLVSLTSLPNDHINRVSPDWTSNRNALASDRCHVRHSTHGWLSKDINTSKMAHSRDVIRCRARVDAPICK